MKGYTGLPLTSAGPFWSGDLWVGCFRHTQACRDLQAGWQTNAGQLEESATLGALCSVLQYFQCVLYQMGILNETCLTMGQCRTILKQATTILPFELYQTKFFFCECVCVRMTVFVCLQGIHLNTYEIYFIIFNSLLTPCMFCLREIFFILGEGRLAPQGCNPSVFVSSWKKEDQLN